MNVQLWIIGSKEAMPQMAKLDRLLTLFNVLHDTSEGLLLDDMADLVGADPRTAERLRDVARFHFDLEKYQIIAADGFELQEEDA